MNHLEQKLTRKERQARRHKLLCEECGKLFLNRELTQFDPWQEEVFNQQVPHRLCRECAEIALRDT